MSKKVIPSIHVPIQEQNGSVAWVWYMFFQWIADNAGKVDLSDYYTKEEADVLLSTKANTDDLKEVAFTGSYDDLSDKPTIPAVGDGTITLTQGGVTKGTFTTNQGGDTTIDLDAGGSAVDIDDLTITMNADDEIQAEAVINKNTGILKHWSGTKAQYDAMPSHASDTIYIITDDTSPLDVYTKTEVNTLLSAKADLASPAFTGVPTAPTPATSSNTMRIATTKFVKDVLKAIWPVGSIYIGTQSTCPLATLISGSTWELVAADRSLQGSSTNHAAGTTIEAGLPDHSHTQVYKDVNFRAPYGSADRVCWEGTTFITVDTGLASANNSIYGNSTTVQPPAYVVNVWRRTQ